MQIIKNENYQNAEKAVNNLFSDTSVSQSDTIDMLKELQALIDVMIDALEEDIANAEAESE